MLVGQVKTANIDFNKLYEKLKVKITAELAKVDKDLCYRGTTKRLNVVSYYNSIFIYFAIIYSDVNKNTLSVKDEAWFKCYYKWKDYVSAYKALGIDLNMLAESLDLFTKKPVNHCAVYCT